MSDGNTKAKPNPRRTLVLASVLAAVAAMAVTYKLRHAPGSDQDRPATTSAASTTSKTIVELPPNALVKPDTLVFPHEHGLAARAAIQKGDYATAERIGAEMLSSSTMQLWHFYPFNSFIGAVVPGVDEAFLKHLDQWIEKDEKSALAHLLSAIYYNELAWTIRGENSVAETSDENLALFADHNRTAAAEALSAIRLDPNNPYCEHMLLRILAARGNTDLMEQAFQEAIGKFPAYYALYESRLNTLAPKWGGSHQAMRAFVEHYAGTAPTNSPLRLLYLEMYQSMLNDAALACRQYTTEYKDKCIASAMDSLVDDKLIADVKDVFALYDTTDRVKFSLEVWPLLRSIVAMSGGHLSGAVLQSAAEQMHSDLQLVGNNPGKNSFVLDDVAARYWQRQKHTENAEKKWQEALLDIDNTEFSNPADKFSTAASIYDSLSALYSDTAQYEKVISYQNAVTQALGHPSFGYGYLSCHAYYKLNQFDAAIKVCTDHLRYGNDLDTHFWRGKVYKALHRPDDELNDMIIVAAQENRFRASAAIEISVIYGDRGDPAGMLKVFDQYPFLFDEKGQEKSSLAVAFNNRCYAKMKLGKLEEALSDCTTSLKYGSLPDAYQKYQDLTRKLGQSQHNAL
jgi:tetratricopeptide (TPR) repeat protein